MSIKISKILCRIGENFHTNQEKLKGTKIKIKYKNFHFEVPSLPFYLSPIWKKKL